MNPIILIALFIIFILVAFAVFISWRSKYKKKNKNKKLLLEMVNYAIKNNLTIDKKQILNNNIIGLDRLNMKLVFFDNNKSGKQIHCIDLGELSSCRLIKHFNKTNGNVSSISLECSFVKPKKASIYLPFYNELSDGLNKMVRLSRNASYWEKAINIFRKVEIMNYS
jgi:hypothetical protein